MNHHLSFLPSLLQLLAVLAVLGLDLLQAKLLYATLARIFALPSMETELRAKLAEKGMDIAYPVFVQLVCGLSMLTPLLARLDAVIVCLWFGWRWAAALLVALHWLLVLAVLVAGRIMEGSQTRSDVPELPADLSNCGFYCASDPDFEQLVVTVKNCADFGLTPEQVAEIAKSDAPFKPDASSQYTFFSVEGFGDTPRMVIAERDRPESPSIPLPTETDPGQ